MKLALLAGVASLTSALNLRGNQTDLATAGFYEQFQYLAKRQQDEPFADDDIVVVPAVYDRFGIDEQQHGFNKVPHWALGDASRHRKVFLYQRLWKDQPYYVPNRGFEGTVFLKFIVDHYDRLPATMVFFQDDYKYTGFEDCLRRDGKLQYKSFVPAWIEHRKTTEWKNFAGSQSPGVEQCWREFAKIFDLKGFEPKKVPAVSAYCCDVFAVGRESVLRRPLSQWKAAYDKAIANKCHDGQWDTEELSPEILALAKPGHLYDDADMDKHASGGALEHLASMIYGFYELDGPRPKDRAACEDFVPDSQCPGSPCKA